MSTKAAENREIAALAGKLRSALEEQHRLGGEADPPTLRRLAELCGNDGADPRVGKAAGNKVFTDRAVVPKQGRKPDLDAPILLKETPEELAERMLAVLESLSRSGGNSNPPTLRLLAERCGVDGADPRVGKAAGTKGFTARAVVPKEGRKPVLDAPIVLKQTPETLAERMLAVLESQRRLGSEAYPPILRRLAQLCDQRASDKLVASAAALGAFTEKAVVGQQQGKGKPALDAPVILKDDIGAGSLASSLLGFALSDAAQPKKGKTTKGGETHAFTVDDLAKRFAKELQDPFRAAVDRGIEQETLPLDFAWVAIKGKPHLFAVQQIRPEALRRSFSSAGRTAPVPEEPQAIPTPADRTEMRPALVAASAPEQPARGFAEAFSAAFDRIDRQTGSMNFVKLSDLRRALPEFPREQFDAGLKQLRLDGRFSLDSHEGRYETLRPDDRDAGIHEAGSLLIYASRR